MNSPKGAGFLYARRGAQPLLEPLIGGGMDGSADGSRLVGEHEYQGTRDLAAFLAWLWEERKIEIPICNWSEQQFLRLSVQAYNSREDVEVLIQAIKEFLV
jgi:selenocysteine lyase/cysteine desulfurase